MNNKIIAVDFDGTLCANCYPDIGAPNLEVINYLKLKLPLIKRCNYERRNLIISEAT